MSEREDGTWRIGRIGGADVLVRPSLLVVGVLLVLVYAPQFDRAGTASPYLLAAVIVVSLYASILIHEIAHLAAAKMFGMPVGPITLHMLGGETRIDAEYRSPWQSALTAAVGPIASLAIGVFALSFAHGLQHGALYAVVFFLGQINLLLAAFNLLPALPLDGGHVLKSIIWAITRRESAGLVVAGWTGIVAAVAVLVWTALSFGGYLADLTRVLLGVFVAWFILQGATAAIRRGRLVGRVDRLTAKGLRTDQPVPDGSPRISVDLRGRQLLVAMAENPAGSYALVDVDGSPAGRLDAAAVDRAYRGAEHR